MLIYIYYLIVFIGIILSSFLFFKKHDSLYLKYFSPMLTLTLLVEFLCQYLANKRIHTISIVSDFSVIETCFYMWVLKNIIKSENVKRVISYLIVGFPVLAFLNILFLQGINSYNTITYSLGCSFLIFLSIYYFFELFKLHYAVKLIEDPSFWICTGLLFFYCVTFPVFVCVNLMKNFPEKFANLIGVVLAITNIILYSLFCIAFLCRIRIKNYSL